VETERARLAFVDDAALLIDEIEAVGPAGVGLLSRIVEIVENGGELDAKLPNAGVGDFATFIEVARTGENDAIFDVALRLPNVAGMGLEDVDGEKADAIVVVVVELIEGRNLPPVGRSRVTAEDEDDRFLRV
jgi:hypothetical protein